MAKKQMSEESEYEQEFDELLSNKKIKEFIIALGYL